MTVTWGLTVHFGILDEPGKPRDWLDELLDGEIVLTASSDNPALRASLVVGEERLELGTVEELLAQARVT